MPDREKVMAALKCVAEFETWSKAECRKKGCPYVWLECERNVAADALALLKEQEARVMTVEEVIHSKDWVWYQWKNTHCGWAIAVNCDGKWIEWEDSTTDQLCKYGEKWRCWTSRPTPEQMRETKWEGDSDA